MEEWMNEGMEERMEAWMDEGMEEWKDEGMEEGMEEWKDEGMEEGMEEWMNDRMEEGMDEYYGTRNGIGELVCCGRLSFLEIRGKPSSVQLKPPSCQHANILYHFQLCIKYS